MSTIQNSLYTSLPLPLNKGGTANTATLANGQTWIGNGTATPVPATLTGINGIAVTNGAGTISVGHNTSLTNGQLYVGNTGNVPTAATLTAGTNIGITNGAGSITVGTTGPASFTWNFNVPTLTTLAAFNGYTIISNASGNQRLNLPSTASRGDMYTVVCYFVTTPQSGFFIQAATGQKIQYNGSSSISGGQISVNSADPFKSTASISLICVDGTAGAQVFLAYNASTTFLLL